MPYKKTHLSDRVLPVLTTLLIVSGSAQAQENPDVRDNLDSVVIVGETTNTEITPEALEFQQANDLSDIFRHIPSVSVGGSVGIAQKVYVRGLEDNLLNITVDGAPQTSTLFHHVGKVFIEPELLKEVEVQAGAGEATSGFGAIGGSIRFKTKSADDLLREGQNFGGLIKGNIWSNDGNKTSISLFGRLGEDWGVVTSFVNSEQEDMEDGDGDDILATAADQDLGFVKFSGDLTDDQHLSLSFEKRDESAEFGVRPNWQVLEGDDLFPMDGERETFVVNHSLNHSDSLNLETTVYQTESVLIQDRFDRWGEYQAAVESIGFDIRNTSYLGDHRIVVGFEMRDDEVVSEYLGPDAMWMPWAWDPAIRSVTEEGEVFGIYAQDHWQLNEDLLISFGARFDEYDLEQVTYDDQTDSDGFSPNIGLRYSLNDNLELSAGYAEAFRGKEIGDGFTNERDPAAPSLDEDLEPETAENTEIGIEYRDEKLALKASIYRSQIDDVILDQLYQGTFYENVGELETDGIELGVAYQWDDLHVSANYSRNEAELNGNTLEGYEHIGLGNARGDTLNLQFSYQWSPQLELGWYVTHVRDLNDIEVLFRDEDLGFVPTTEEIDKPGYTVHDIYLSWRPMSIKGMTFNVAVLNLLDEEYRDHSSVGDYGDIAGYETVVGLNEPGRDLRLSVSYQF
ncbi:MAG: TonB-dependent receptor [Pseudomonadota bacterium]